MKLLQASMLLGFTGLGFYFMKNVITPHAGRNQDFDGLYRLIGNVFRQICSIPLAAIDDVWTNVYRIAGLGGLMGLAKGTSVFDRKGIDTVVDGTAYSVRNVGWLSSKLQTGRLQDYLAWMTVTALLVFAVVWWFNLG